MKLITVVLLLFPLLAGCGFNQYQKNIANNEYNDTQLHADPLAGYLGEWTTAFGQGSRSIKIRPDGKVKICLGPSSGTSYGKMFIKDEQPGLIMETGAIVEFVEITEEFLILDIYGKQEKYYSGVVPDECRSAFRSF